MFYVYIYSNKTDLCIKVVNSYVNCPEEWVKGNRDTVFVNTRPVSRVIDTKDLSILDTNSYVTAILKGQYDVNLRQENATVVIDSLFQKGPYGEVTVLTHACEGETKRREKYIWLFFDWVRVNRDTIYDIIM